METVTAPRLFPVEVVSMSIPRYLTVLPAALVKFIKATSALLTKGFVCEAFRETLRLAAKELKGKPGLPQIKTYGVETTGDVDFRSYRAVADLGGAVLVLVDVTVDEGAGTGAAVVLTCWASVANFRA